MARKLEAGAAQALLETLEKRFAKNPDRHEGVRWNDVREKLEAQPGKLWSLGEMERTGGEPDVIGSDSDSGDLLFVDCSLQSPDGRRSLCYDPQALASRKKNKPDGSAVQAAADMGAELIDEAMYRRLQEMGEFDTTTSSWLRTPTEIRELGGAIFGDRRFNTVFVYHNGAESYYAARGFRCLLRV